MSQERKILPTISPARANRARRTKGERNSNYLLGTKKGKTNLKRFLVEDIPKVIKRTTLTFSVPKWPPAWINLGKYFQEGLQWPQDDQEWLQFSQFLDKMIKSQVGPGPQKTKQWINEARFFKNADETERRLNDMLQVDQVMSALHRLPPQDGILAKKIETQIFQYEL